MSRPHAFCVTSPVNDGSHPRQSGVPYFLHGPPPPYHPGAFQGVGFGGPAATQPPPAYRLAPSTFQPPEQRQIFGAQTFQPPESPVVADYDESLEMSGRKRRSREDLPGAGSCPPSPIKGVNYSCMADMEAMGLLKDVPRKPPNSFGPGDWNAIRTCSKEWAGICHELLLAGYDIRLGEAGRSSLKKEISKKLKEKSHLREVCVAQVCRLKNANVMQLMQMAEIVGCLHTALRISSSYWREYNRKQSAGYALVGGHRRASRVAVPGAAKLAPPRSRKNSNSEPGEGSFPGEDENNLRDSCRGGGGIPPFIEKYGMPYDNDPNLEDHPHGPSAKRAKLDAEPPNFNFFEDGGGPVSPCPNHGVPTTEACYAPTYHDDTHGQFFHFSDHGTGGRDLSSGMHPTNLPYMKPSIPTTPDNVFPYDPGANDSYFKQEESATGGLTVDGLASDWIFSVLCSSAPVVVESPTDPTSANSLGSTAPTRYYE